MKLTEIGVEEFNKLAFSEPDTTIYQSSYWSDYMIGKGFEPLFLKYSDDTGLCEALAMLLLKKESLFSFHPTAFCPCGYLINYYDRDLLVRFNEDLKEFLKERKISKLVIEPTVRMNNGDYTNEAIAQSLLECGYVKSNDLFAYSLDLTGHEETKNPRSLILKTNIISEDEFISFLRDKESDYLEAYRAAKPFATLYSVRIDSDHSRRNLEEKIAENKNYVDEHDGDYKFEDDVVASVSRIQEYRNTLSYLDKYERNSKNTVLAVACVCEYARGCSVFFLVNRDGDDFFSAEKALIDRIAQDEANKGHKRIDSSRPFAYAEEVRLIGEYSLKI